MDRHEMDFLEPNCPFIIIRKLTVEVIEKAIRAHTQDNAYWLKLHHFLESLKSDMFNKSQEDQDTAYDSFNID